MSVPEIHHWLAGDSWNADRFNEIGTQINWLRNPPLFHARRRAATQTIEYDGTAWERVEFDTVVADPYGFIDIVSDPFTITVTEPGWYSCEIYMSWVNFGAVDARVIMGLFKNEFVNTGLLLRNDKGTQPSASSNINMRKEGTYFFNVGDFIHLGAHHDDSSSSRTLANTSDAECTGIRMRWVSK